MRIGLKNINELVVGCESDGPNSSISDAVVVIEEGRFSGSAGVRNSRRAFRVRKSCGKTWRPSGRSRFCRVPFPCGLRGDRRGLSSAMCGQET